MIPDDFKQQLLNRVDIVDVIERHVQLRKAGQNYVARCPFHNEKTPSFSVSPSKQFYHCFGCGVHGNAITFVMEHGGLGYIDAVKELAAMVGMNVPEIRASENAEQGRPDSGLSDALALAARYYKEQLKQSEEAIAYLKERGLTGEIAARYGIGYAGPDWQGLARVFSDYKTSSVLKDAGLVIDGEGGRRYDRFRDRIMFPILNARGTMIGFGGRVIGQGEPKYLNSPETALFEKGRELYGLVQARQRVRASGRIVVVEGYMDVVGLAQCGFEGAVATLGTATTPVHVEKLLRLADEIVFCFDGDAAGRRAAWRALEVSLAKLADAKRVSFLFLPDGEDPDSYVRAHGHEAFDTLLRQSLPLSDLLVRELTKRTDLTCSEGRARLLHLAKPLVKQIPAPVLSLMLRTRLAECAQVRLTDVDELFDIRSVPSHGGPRRVPAQVARRAPATLTQRVLLALMQDPSLATQIERDLLDESDRYTPALSALLELLTRWPATDARTLVPVALEQLHDPAVGTALRELETQLLDAPDIDHASEISSAISGLRERRQSRRLTELSVKGDRSGAEQAEFEALLRSLSQRAKDPASSTLSRV
jgi:DNA primase